MKKTFFSLGLGLSLVSSAYALNSTLDQLNSEVADLLSPIVNEHTVAQANITAAEINADRAVKAALNGVYHKIGTYNTLVFKIDNLSYDYGDGTAPTTILKGSIGLDFTKFFSQELINSFIPAAAETIENMARNMSGPYSDAIYMRGVVTSANKDNDDNYTGLSALINFKIILDKIPQEEQKDIRVTEGSFALSVDLKKGISLDAYVISNPLSTEFEAGSLGLKELIENVLAHDEGTLLVLGSYIQSEDSDIEELVNHEPNWKKFLGL